MANSPALPARGIQFWFLSGSLLLLAPAAAAQSSVALTQANQLFNGRMENRFRYLEALLPPGLKARQQYLLVDKRRYLLESAWARVDSGTGAGSSQYWYSGRENYWLWGKDDHVTNVAWARYQLSGVSRPHDSLRSGWGMYHRYASSLGGPDFTGLDAGQVQLQGNLRPLDLLRLQPDAFRPRQTLVVLDARPELQGDTLACYQLHASGNDPAWGSDQTYLLTLLERRTPGNRRWHDNHEETTTWVIEPAQRRVTATVYARPRPRPTDKTEPYSRESEAEYYSRYLYSSWTRTYSNRTDFTEVHTSTSSPSGHAGPMGITTYYRRTFRQLSPTQSTDTYAFPDPNLDNEPAELSLTVVGTARP